MADSCDTGDGTRSSQEVAAVSAALQHPVGPFTVEDWQTLNPRDDGSRLELLWGHFLVNPPPTGHHQHAGVDLLITLRAALRDAGRTDLHVEVGVGVEIDTETRNALIPDVVVMDTRPVGKVFRPENVLLVAEIWSPGNKAQERTEKADAYAVAGIPHFWTVDQDRFGVVRAVTAFRLANGRYVQDAKALAGTLTVLDVAGVPVKFDPRDLSP
jgi:Uma2 family endonuclease